jgi:hypothetical protein
MGSMSLILDVLAVLVRQFESGSELRILSAASALII